jgi:hypothetical protein
MLFSFSAPRDDTARASCGNGAKSDFLSLTLSFDEGKSHDVAVEHPVKGAPVLRVWTDGRLVRGPEEVPALGINGGQDFPDAGVNLGADFTAVVQFEANG